MTTVPEIAPIELLDDPIKDIRKAMIENGEFAPADMGRLVGWSLARTMRKTKEELGSDDLSDFLQGFMGMFEDEQLADMLLKFPLTEDDGNPDGRSNRQLALIAADVLGPDWAQSLYRFSVLTTKLA